ETLLASMRTAEALEASEAALAIDPGHAHACMVRGLALAELGRLHEASQGMAHAQSLNPDAKDRATSLFEPNQTMASPPPDAEDIFLHRGFRHLGACDWAHRDLFLREFEVRIAETLAAGKPIRDYSFAYDVLGTSLDPQLHGNIMRALASQLQRKAAEKR